MAVSGVSGFLVRLPSSRNLAGAAALVLECAALSKADALVPGAGWRAGRVVEPVDHQK